MSYKILQGDCLEQLRTLPDESVQCCISSPPYYGLRDYGVAGQIGLEKTPQEFVEKLVEVFREVRRVLRKDGTCWVNLGDSYASKFPCNRRNVVGNGSPDGSTIRESRLYEGLKEKDLMGIPWRVAFALQSDGWYLRQDIIWHKPNPMPESVTDRCTKAHEYIFLLSKSDKYFYNQDPLREPHAESTLAWTTETKSYSAAAKELNGDMTRLNPISEKGQGFRHLGLHPNGRNKRSVWTVTTQPYSEAHFATFPPKLVEPMILAGSREGDTVLDPFNGAGTTGLVALRHRREYVGIELNPEYVAITEKRLAEIQVRLF